VEKFGGKEEGRRGQGGWIKGDLCRSGRRPLVGGCRSLVAPDRVIAGRSTVARQPGDQQLLGGQPQPVAGSDQRSPAGCGPLPV
jgi:hypothetical protein